MASRWLASGEGQFHVKTIAKDTQDTTLHSCVHSLCPAECSAGVMRPCVSVGAGAAEVERGSRLSAGGDEVGFVSQSFVRRRPFHLLLIIGFG